VESRVDGWLLEDGRGRVISQAGLVGRVEVVVEGASATSSCPRAVERRSSDTAHASMCECEAGYRGCTALEKASPMPKDVCTKMVFGGRVTADYDSSAEIWIDEAVQQRKVDVVEYRTFSRRRSGG
jgi:hypothetical protein